MSDVTLYFWQGPFADFRHVEEQPTLLRMSWHVTALVRLQAMLRRPPGLRGQLRPEAPRPEAAKDGYRLANRVRALLGNEVGPIDDPRRLLEDDFDVLVLAEPLATSRVHALTLKDNLSGGVVVLINSCGERFHNPQAQRVDLLHELSHVLFDPPNGDVNLVEEDANDADPKKLVEQRARAFAAELLMPAEGLRTVLGKPAYELSVEKGLRMVEKAREAFDTPIEITVNHLVNREYVVDWNRDVLIARARAESPRVPEGRSLFAPDRPSLLQRRLAQAVRERLLPPESAHLLIEGKVDSIPRSPMTVSQALDRLAAAGLVAEAIEGPDVHLLGGVSVDEAGGIRCYEDAFAILSEPGVGFTAMLSGPGQLDETHTFPSLAPAIDAVIARRPVRSSLPAARHDSTS